MTGGIDRQAGDVDEDDDDGLAAEYVLGTLPAPERTAVEARIVADHDFARRVTRWETRLAPMNAAYAELRPPRRLRRRVERHVFGRPPAIWQRLRPSLAPLWLVVFGGAVAAGFYVLVLPALLPPSGPAIVTELRSPDSALVVAAEYAPDSGRITLRHAAGPAAPAGRDYEVWAITEGARPVSLALLRGGSVEVTAGRLAPGTVLAITLEPEGGAPGGVATGPVVASGTLTPS